MDPLDYALRAHEILEDAQRDFLSGADVRWSGEGVLATAAAARRRASCIGTLAPLISNQDSRAARPARLRRLRATLARDPQAHHAHVADAAPSSPHAEHAELDGALGAALEALSRSRAPPRPCPADIPKIPSSKSSKKTP